MNEIRIVIIALTAALAGCAISSATQRTEHERACSRFAAEAQVAPAHVRCVESPRPGAWFCSLRGER